MDVVSHRRGGFALAAVFFSAILSASAGSLGAERVRYVVDGDTVILENHQRVRLIGVDAPEVSHRKYGRKAEPFGKDSKHFLRDLVEGREVELKGGAEPFDRFGRRLAYLYLADGTFVNRRMIEDGYAETFRKFPFEFKQEFRDVEKKARAEGRGMWAAREKTWTERFLTYLESAMGLD
jgi:micrococcal nuclease